MNLQQALKQNENFFSRKRIQRVISKAVQYRHEVRIRLEKHRSQYPDKQMPDTTNLNEYYKGWNDSINSH